MPFPPFLDDIRAQPSVCVNSCVAQHISSRYLVVSTDEFQPTTMIRYEGPCLNAKHVIMVKLYLGVISKGRSFLKHGVWCTERELRGATNDCEKRRIFDNIQREQLWTQSYRVSLYAYSDQQCHYGRTIVDIGYVSAGP